MPDSLQLITTHLADPRNKSRKRLFCDARIVFTAIARKSGWSYSEVAEAIGKSRATIYHYEKICNAKNLGKTYEIYLKLLNETGI
jgi:ribosome-binding protein aMBF1 (putative translation factor)